MKTAIELSKEAGILFQCHTGILGGVNTSTEGAQSLERIERLVELVRADEREECAQVVWEMKGQCWAYDHDTIATAIRARSKT